MFPAEDGEEKPVKTKPAYLPTDGLQKGKSAKKE